MSGYKDYKDFCAALGEKETREYMIPRSSKNLSTPRIEPMSPLHKERERKPRDKSSDKTRGREGKYTVWGEG